MSLKGIINNVTATSTHIRTNSCKTSNTALQDQEQTASQKYIYNHDTAVNTSRQLLLLITQKKLELIPKAKTVKCTPNPSEVVLARKTSIKPKTREKEQPKATPSS